MAGENIGSPTTNEKTRDVSRKEFLYDFCFTALQHISGHFGRGQLL